MPTVQNQGMQDPVECWCCGSSFPEEQVVRLGQHPEAAVCLDCALFLNRRALQRRDVLSPSLAGRARSGLQICRRLREGPGAGQEDHSGVLIS